MSYTLPNRQTFDVVYDKLKELLELYSDSMPKDYQYKILLTTRERLQILPVVEYSCIGQATPI